jgi:hypothetical protein
MLHEKYIHQQVHLSSIIRTDKISQLQPMLERVDSIITKALLVLRLYILDKYYHNQQHGIPEIDLDLVLSCFSSVMKESRLSKQTSALYKLHSFNLEDGSKLKTILGYSAETVLQSIRDSINDTYTYYKHLYTSYYGKKFGPNTERYLQWIGQASPNFIQPKSGSGVRDDTMKYIVFLSLELGKIEGHTFNFFPMRNFNLRINNKVLNELSGQSWEEYFDVPEFNMKNYFCDREMMTDGKIGYIQYIHIDFIEGRLEKLKKRLTIKSY